MYITNIEAPVYQKKCTLINASPEKVWKKIADIENWPSWLPNVSRTKVLGPLKADTKFRWVVSGLLIQSTLHIVEPYENFGWSGRTLGIFAVHNWSFKELDGSTVVTVSESMEGWLARIFKKSMNNFLEKDMQRSLDYLIAACESKQSEPESEEIKEIAAKEAVMH